MSSTPNPTLLSAPADAMGSFEARFASLAETVARLEARIAALEGATPTLPASVPSPLAVAAPVPAADLPNPTRFMGLLGRTCLILGGATFIRALVDAGTLPHGAGVALGLAYAISWAVLADRAKRPLDATFHALASILIAYPLLVESTARFGILEPALAAVLLLGVTLLHGIVAWRRDLKPIIWFATFFSLGSGLALMSARRSIEPFLAVFLILGVITLWATDGRRWHGLRWPTALAANLGVLILTSLAAWPGGTPEAYHGITPGVAMGFALTLVVIYIGSFAFRMLQQRRVVNAFEVIQTILVLLTGFGGAFRVALASGSGAGWLGAGVSVAGLGCYATAFPFAEDRDETRANFNFFTSLALVFLLMGGPILLPASGFASLSGLIGLGAMILGLRLRRVILMLQSSVFLVASALASGLFTASFRAFMAPQGPESALAGSSVIALLALAITLAWFLRHRPVDAVTVRVRPLLLVLGAMTAAGAGSLLIWACRGAIGTPASDAGALAAIRTAVLSLLVITLAWSGRRLPILNLRWLVYPLLIITALKFLFEDMAVGRPLTLFLGFTCFGATLMLAPRLLKTSAPKGGDDDSNASKLEVDS